MILGTAQLCTTYGALEQSVESTGDDPVSFLVLASQLGVAGFDTAPVYPGAESALGSAALPTPIHTKLDPATSPIASIQGSLQRLRREHVEVVYLHEPDAVLVDGGAAVETAAELVKGGFSKALGASVYSVEALTSAVEADAIDVVQIPLNPMVRSVGEASLLLDHSKRVIGRSALAQGVLAAEVAHLPPSVRHLGPSVARFQCLAREFERSPAELALLWSRDHPALDDLIVGAASVAQLEDVLSILGSRSLSDDERAKVDELRIDNEEDFDPRRWNR